jgi:hypothetical protein
MRKILFYFISVEDHVIKLVLQKIDRHRHTTFLDFKEKTVLGFDSSLSAPFSDIYLVLFEGRKNFFIFTFFSPLKKPTSIWTQTTKQKNIL